MMVTAIVFTCVLGSSSCKYMDRLEMSAEDCLAYQRQAKETVYATFPPMIDKVYCIPAMVSP